MARVQPLHVAFALSMLAACQPHAPAHASPAQVKVAPAATPQETPLPPAPSGEAPRTFACGKARCRLGKETCCSDGDDGVCVPSVAPGPDDKTQLLASQIVACDAAGLRYALASVARCNRSADCGTGEYCCDQFLYGGASAQLCLKSDSHANPCEYGELCGDGGACRSAGAACVEGRCRKPLASMQCGEATCSGASVCCGEPPACVSPAQCKGPRYECMHPADCLAGEHCASGVLGTTCVGVFDLANTAVVCDSDADCPANTMLCQGKLKCTPASVPHLETCVCP